MAACSGLLGVRSGVKAECSNGSSTFTGDVRKQGSGIMGGGSHYLPHFQSRLKAFLLGTCFLGRFSCAWTLFIVLRMVLALYSPCSPCLIRYHLAQRVDFVYVYFGILEARGIPIATRAGTPQTRKLAMQHENWNFGS